MSHAIETFFAAWGIADSDTRVRALFDSISSEIYYVDPRTSAPITTHQALADYVAMYTQYAPGASAQVVNISDTKGHRRATVKFSMTDGQAQFGQYFIDCDSDGLLQRVIGFVGLGEPS